MPIVQHSLVNTKMTLMTFHHHNHATHFLREWSKSESTSTQSTTFHSSQHLGPPPHLLTELDWKASARPIEGGQKVKGHGERGRAHQQGL